MSIAQPNSRRDLVSVSIPTNVPLPRSTFIGVDVMKVACTSVHPRLFILGEIQVAVNFKAPTLEDWKVMRRACGICASWRGGRKMSAEVCDCEPCFSKRVANSKAPLPVGRPVYRSYGRTPCSNMFEFARHGCIDTQRAGSCRETLF